ncbi:glutamyl-tRNA synthetase [Thermodesulfobium narugense DSM 14796]|uniref:Glutamate--tRNA ligase n=1 Tax=Thermodesulfobium narugense DSM 14796 TaxID=747365 RepID=M1E7F4_9BACT|nr:glutamate--tRNA ligase [Thermodesulfobium narugense]AEE13959.1 glutamyl-tRNA synthetase [Thermodesulfobium narugense DSM 14796]
MVRVRFAPSPTGALHIGGAHTALFNYLFARRLDGKFILRIEDTDTERSSKEYEAIILESLKWLGIEWDEGPYYQSKRLDLYREKANELLKKGVAYECFCTPEELKERREMMVKMGRPPKYDGRCRDLSEEQKRELRAKGLKPALRIRIPEGKSFLRDAVKGEVSCSNDSLGGDMVIMKSDNYPTYNFAVVVDDIDMNITHVIRGDDHLTNTFKQMIIYKAFGKDLPKFAHIPLLLGPDKTKLSKRHGAASVLEYKEMGYLSDALFNFLSLLGWTPKEGQEIFSRDELISMFCLAKLNSNPAVFDIKRLEWMNSQYIKNMDDSKLFDLAKPFYEKAKINVIKDDYTLRAINLGKVRAKTLEDLVNTTKYFFIDPELTSPEVENIKSNKSTLLLLNRFLELVNSNYESHTDLENKSREMAVSMNLSFKDLVHPLRLILTGMKVGPGLFEVVDALGRDKVIKRVSKFLSES